MTDPTREDLIALLSENLTWRSPTPEGPRATISPQWVERMADALLARLRPAWERMTGEHIEWLCEREQVVHPVQRAGILQPCPNCGDAMVPTSQNLRTIDALRADLQSIREENQRLAKEHTEVHEWNMRLVVEHYTLGDRLRALEADLQRAQENVRACAEALAKLTDIGEHLAEEHCVAEDDPTAGPHLEKFNAALYDARAALARPGVQAEMKQ